MSLFGKNVRTDVIILAVIAAIAGPILALKLPVVLAMLGTVATIALIVYIINICCVPMPVCVPMIAMTLAAVSYTARFSAVLILAPSALLSLNGILLALIAGMWLFFAIGLATRVSGWGDRTPFGGGGMPRG